VIATSRGAPPFTATWDYYDVVPMALVGVTPSRGPVALRLQPPHPNPVVSGATVRFDLPASARVRLALYDVTGARTRTLLDGERGAGSHDLRWDGRDDGGRTVPAGVYFLRLECGREVRTQRVALVR
jgi:hypothetical protein